MTTLLLGHCIIHDFLITQAILNSEDHISVGVCLIVSTLTVWKNLRQLLEQLFTLNCIFPMCDIYIPWEYEMWDVTQESLESRHNVCSAERKESISADMPKAYTCVSEGGESIDIHDIKVYHIILTDTTHQFNTSLPWHKAYHKEVLSICPSN